jgi:regulator of protease activity HflC (stomatin/prohibitin superfamily)
MGQKEVETVKSLGWILWASAVASLVITAFMSAVIWAAAPLLMLALLYSVLRVSLYRPPENHLGVIYQLGRLWRLVGPDEWVCVIPWVNEIKLPISLHLRRAEISFCDLLTEDQVPVDCNLLVYYQLDLRLARAEFWSQALRIPDEGWNSIIRTVAQETAGEIIGGIAFQQLLTPEGRGHLKCTLSALLADRVRGLGLIVNPRTGVSMQTLKPTNAIWCAMVDRFAGVLLGEAALDRVRPILQELSQHYPEVAWMPCSWSGRLR